MSCVLNKTPHPGFVGTFTSYFKGDPGLPPERPSPSRSVSPRRNTHVTYAHTLSPLYASSSPAGVNHGTLTPSQAAIYSPVGVNHGTLTPSQASIYSPVGGCGRETSFGTPPMSSHLTPSPAPPKSKFIISTNFYLSHGI